ncbi:MAG: alginate export family protein [Bacteroidetes bacterium]|nr:alginate export family protein [Bacteroidota bacterium]
MKHILNFRKLFCFFILIQGYSTVRAQSTQPSSPDTTKKPAADTVVRKPEQKPTLTIGLDMRTRAELKHGYRSLPVKDTSAAADISQRTRLNFDYKSKSLDVFLSIQDARIWGQQDPKEGQTGSSTTASPSTTFPLYFFEAYAEPHFGSKFSMRIGRQRVIYDNQRLFSENDWRVPANSHDGIRLIYNNNINFTTELLAAFNQSGENTFTTKYQPILPNYKDLFVHYLNWKMTDKLALTTINVMDGFQSSVPEKYTTTYQRFTSGGRLEYSAYNWYVTFSGYYQYGKDSSGKKIGAYYIQPEIRYSTNSFTARLGMEYLSGADSSTHPSNDKNFVPLYGTSHRFLGNLDLFTSFPRDVNGAGLINPYLFFQMKFNNVTLRMENHLFYSQSKFVYNGTATDKYLGFENDWRLNYKPNKFTDIEIGACWAIVSKSMAIIKKGGDNTLIPYFGYVSLKLTPTLGKFTL